MNLAENKETLDIVKVSRSDIVSEIINSRKGEHNLLVYPDHESFRAIYAPLCKKLLESNDIVVFLTCYEST